MAIREGAWDCPSCGRERNRGPARFCAGCGAPRGAEVELYLPDGAAEVTDPEALQRARSGPDWTCTYCEGDNPADDAFCAGCGAGKDGAPPRPVIEHREETPRPAVPPPPQRAVSAPVASPRLGKKEGKKEGKKGGSCLRLGCGLLGLGGLVVAVLAFFFGGPTEEVATVTGHRWSRTVEVERLATVAAEAWEDELPQGARVLESRREVYSQRQLEAGSESRVVRRHEKVQVGTEKVKVGVRDLGNGYFEDIYEDRPVYEMVEKEENVREPVYRQEPVYKQKVRYEVDEWQTDRQETASGDDDQPRWPVVELGDREREGKRTAVYEVLFRCRDGKTRVLTAAQESRWRGLRQGKAYRIRVGGNKIRKVLGPG